MQQAQSLIWKVVAALGVLFVLLAGLLWGVGCTTPEQQMAQANTAACRAAPQGSEGSGSGQSGAATASGASDTAASGASSAASGTSINTAGDGTGGGSFSATGMKSSSGSEPELSGKTVAASGLGGPMHHPEAFNVKTGEELFTAACQSCHMPGGVGANSSAGTKNYPALAGDKTWRTGSTPPLLS